MFRTGYESRSGVPSTDLFDAKQYTVGAAIFAWAVWFILFLLVGAPWFVLVAFAVALIPAPALRLVRLDIVNRLRGAVFTSLIVIGFVYPLCLLGWALMLALRLVTAPLRLRLGPPPPAARLLAPWPTVLARPFRLTLSTLAAVGREWRQVVVPDARSDTNAASGTHPPA